MDHKHDQTPPWKLFPFVGTVMKNLFSKPETIDPCISCTER